MCRHLRDGDLGLELEALVFDLRWLHVQAHMGGILGLKKDYSLLKSFLVENGTSERILLALIQSIQDALEVASLHITKGPRVLSYLLLSNLFAMSETDEFLYNVKVATPKPYLSPLR